MLLYLSEPAGVLAWELGLRPVGGPVKASCPPGSPGHELLKGTILPEMMSASSGRGAQAAGTVPSRGHGKLSNKKPVTRVGLEAQGPPFLMLCFPRLLWARPQAPTSQEGGGLAWPGSPVSPFHSPAHLFPPSTAHALRGPTPRPVLPRTCHWVEEPQVLMPATYCLPGRPP